MRPKQLPLFCVGVVKLRETSRVEEVYAALRSYVTTHGIAPTMAELAAALGLSQVMVVAYLDQLERCGVVTSIYASGKRSPRSLRIVARVEVGTDPPIGAGARDPTGL